MAKKIKFPLKLADGTEARTLDELKEHFDIESVVGYFSDGRLLNWLRSRYYDDEADKVEQLTKDDPQLHKKLCEIFGVESEEEVDPEEIARRQERLNRLKQYTDDREIWGRIDQVAFDQEDLSDLLDEDKTLIYLCANRFTIPLRVTDKTYVGIGKAIAVIRSNKIIDFDALNITFKKVRFDDDYQKILDTKPEKSEVTVKYSVWSTGILALLNRAASYHSNIKLIMNGQTVDIRNPDAKSWVPTLKNNDLIKIVAEGSDAEQAVMELKKYIEF